MPFITLSDGRRIFVKEQGIPQNQVVTGKLARSLRERFVERNANALLNPGNIRGLGRRFTGVGISDISPRQARAISFADTMEEDRLVNSANERRLLAVRLEQQSRQEAEDFFQQDRVTPSQIKAVNEAKRQEMRQKMGLL